MAKFAAFALLGLTTCDMFKDDCYDVAGFRDPSADAPGPFAELAAARRELSVSAETCRAAVEKVRAAAGLDQI